MTTRNMESFNLSYLCWYLKEWMYGFCTSSGVLFWLQR